VRRETFLRIRPVHGERLDPGVSMSTRKFAYMLLAGVLLCAAAATSAKAQLREGPSRIGSPGGSVSQKLTCYIPMASPIATAPTAARTFAGTRASVRIGINERFGGMITSLELINNAAPQEPLQLINAVNNAAEAGWQTAFITKTPDSTTISNQGGGGRKGYQWGYGGSYSIGGSGFQQENWIPLATDNIGEPGTSPCDHTSNYFANGQFSHQINIVPGTAGTVIRISEINRIQAITTQRWAQYVVDQGIYFRKSAILRGNCRVYLATPAGLITGPIELCRNGGLRGNVGPAVEKLYPRQIGGVIDELDAATYPLSYAVIVWSVAGQDIGMAIHPKQKDQPFSAVFAYGERRTCRLPVDFCGGAHWHSKLNAPVSWAAGETREFAMEYDIGTPDELAGVGFPIR
jgi:hypothetical protein